MGRLYVVGTPIGNLEDISPRALRILRQVRLIAAENPQRTQRLLARYDIQTPMTRYTDAYERKKQDRLQAVRLPGWRASGSSSWAFCPAAGAPAGHCWRRWWPAPWLSWPTSRPTACSPPWPTWTGSLARGPCWPPAS